MARLIDADAVAMKIYEQVAWERDLAVQQLRSDYGVSLGEKKKEVVPTRSQFERMAAQLGYEPVIHCSECKHYCECVCDYHAAAVCADWFCWNGERRTDE